MATKRKSIIEEALLEAKSLEDALKANTKEMLASHMKQEIENIVESSLNEEDEEVEEIDVEGSDEEMEEMPALDAGDDSVYEPEGSDEPEESVDLSDIRTDYGIEELPEEEIQEGGDCYHCKGDDPDCDHCDGSGYVQFDDDPDEPSQEEIDANYKVVKKYIMKGKKKDESVDINENMNAECQAEYKRLMTLDPQKANKFKATCMKLGPNGTVDQVYSMMGESVDISEISPDTDQMLSDIEANTPKKPTAQQRAIAQDLTGKQVGTVDAEIDRLAGSTNPAIKSLLQYKKALDILASQDSNIKQQVAGIIDKMNANPGPDSDSDYRADRGDNVYPEIDDSIDYDLQERSDGDDEPSISNMSDEDLMDYVGQKEEDLIDDMQQYLAPDFLHKDNFEEMFDKYREEVLEPAAHEISQDHAMDNMDEAGCTPAHRKANKKKKSEAIDDTSNKALEAAMDELKKLAGLFEEDKSKFDEAGCVKEMKKLYASGCAKESMYSKLNAEYKCNKKQFEELYAAHCV